MKTKEGLLRELQLRDLQRFLLVATPQKRYCAICGKETWRPRYCSQHDPGNGSRVVRHAGSH